jgi:hypothetical protein
VFDGSPANVSDVEVVCESEKVAKPLEAES